jgi:DNA-binding IscR family transcriptional regulator
MDRPAQENTSGSDEVKSSYQPCQDCDDVKRCKVRLAMTKVRDATSGILDTTTVADMLHFGGRKKAKAGR